MRTINRFVRPLLAMCITGGVMATSIPFSAADDAKPAVVQTVKEGLSVSVTSDRDIFAANQTPAFDVKFANQRDTAFRLTPGVNMTDMWDILAENTATGAKYRVHSTAQYRRRVIEITTLGTKESKTVHLDFSKFQFIHLQQEQAEKPLTQLPAGKYRLTIGFKFEGIFDIPESVKAVAWIGELKTDAIAFEIGAK